MEEILLTSADFVRRTTNLSDNMQDKYLLSAIREAQEIGLQSILGSLLYDSLKQMVNDNTISNEENVDYKNLLNQCQYYLAYKTISNVIVVSSVKVDNIGATQNADEMVSPLALKDIFKMEQYYTNKADFYCKRLQEYLLKNHEQFKELRQCDIDAMHSNLYSAASCGMYLGGPRGKKNRYYNNIRHRLGYDKYYD